MDIALFKRMYRLIDYQRRLCLVNACKSGQFPVLPKNFTYKHLDYLMLIRMAMPCNLSHVMALTGLSSSAASLFIDKMVRAGMVDREVDPQDRRNILIRPTEKIQTVLDKIDEQLDKFIDDHLHDCSQEELAALESAGALVCRKIGGIK